MASFMFFYYILATQYKHKEEAVLILFLTAFILGDNFSGRLGFAQNLRFTALGLTLMFLQNRNLFEKNLGNKLLIFSLIALVITFIYSPIGTPALLRAVSYWLMALSIFKLVQLIYKKNQFSLSQILIFLSSPI